MVAKPTKAGYRAGRDEAALAENIELLTGQRGNKLDKAITYRELADIGLITLRKAANNSFVGSASPGLLPDETIERPVSPTGVIANGAFHTILVEWDMPAYKGHAYAEVWRAQEDNRAKAVMVGTSAANLYSDAIGKGASVYYWVRFVNRNNVAGPFNSAVGTHAETSRDVQDILDELQGKIQESHLSQELLAPIKGISEIKVDLSDLDSALSKIKTDLSVLDDREKQVNDLLESAQTQLGNNYISVTVIQEQLRAKIDRYQGEFDNFRDAVFSVNPSTGEITMEAVNSVRSELGAQISVVSQHLDAVESIVNTCVTRAEIQGDLERITNVEQQIDGINATLTQTATKSDVSNVASTVTQVGQELDATKSALTQKAAQTQVDSQGQRLSVAEQQISANTEANKATAQRVEQVKAALENADGIISASITSLSQAVATDKEATAQALNALRAELDGQSAAISDLNKVVSGDGQSLAGRFESIQASIDLSAKAAMEGTLASAEADRQSRKAQGSIKRDQEVIVNEQKAQAQTIEDMRVSFEVEAAKTDARITTVQTTLADADKAMAERVDQIESNYKAADAESAASVSALQKTVADGDQALAEALSKVESDYKSAVSVANSSISALQQTVSSADSSLAQEILRVESDYKTAVSSANSSISTLQKTVSDADKALSDRVDQIDAAYKAADASTNSQLTSAQKAISDGDKALGERVDQVVAAYKAADSENSAAIQAEQRARSTADGALGERIDTVQATASGLTSAVQTHSQAISDLKAGAEAMWTVKAQAGDIKAGIGLVAKSDGTSQVMVSASQFFVFNPNSPSATSPLFAIDNGQVVMAEAIIRTATIQILNSQQITADNVKAGISLSAPVINGGQITIGTNFSVNAAGAMTAWSATLRYVTSIYGTFSQATIDTCTINNCIINENCDVKGTVYAGKIVGDVYTKRAWSISKSSATQSPGWYQDISLGNIYKATFNRNIWIAQIYGDIGFSTGPNGVVYGRFWWQIIVNGTVLEEAYTDDISITNTSTSVQSYRFTMPTLTNAVIPANVGGATVLRIGWERTVSGARSTPSVMWNMKVQAEVFRVDSTFS